MWNRSEVVNFLIDQGTDVNMFDDTNSLPLHLLGYFRMFEEHPTPLFPLLRTLLKYHDELYDPGDEMALRFLKNFQGTPEEFIFLQQTCYPSFYESPRTLPRSLAAHYLNFPMIFNDIHTPEILHIILYGIPFAMCSPESESHSDFIERIETPDLPCLVAKQIGKHRSWCRIIPSSSGLSESWCRFFHEMLVRGFNMNRIDEEYESSPFLAFCDGYFELYPVGLGTSECNEDFRWWLRSLQNAGVDLRSLGKTEAKILRNLGGPREYNISRPHFTHDKSIRFIGFSHGPLPEDWEVWVSEGSDAFAGEFWEMIERRIEIPGGWSSNIHLFL